MSRLAPLLLLVALAIALLARSSGPLQMANPDTSAADGMLDVLGSLPDDSTVLVAFDPDVGTYAEVRGTVRVLLADLMDRDARLAFISLTPEGRALALAELARLERLEANARQLVDLGFIPGAEAALVALSRELRPAAGTGVMATVHADLDLAAVALTIVVGGNDLGPRSWVEQMAIRVDGLRLVAVAPSVLLPDLQPYLASGQLEALLATPRDGAAYRASVELGSLDRLVDATEPTAVPILVGLLAAIGVLGAGAGTRVLAGLRVGRAREAS